MGNLFGCCARRVSTDAASEFRLDSFQFITEILRRINNREYVDREVSLKKLINPIDLEIITPPPVVNPNENNYFQENEEFLVDEANGEYFTRRLVNYIINTLYEENITLEVRYWCVLFTNLNHAIAIPCGRTRLLQLCFLSHICKLFLKKKGPITYTLLTLSKHIEFAERQVPIERINAFCSAARQNPDIMAIVGANFVQPRIITYRLKYNTSWDFHGFVLDGNFIAVEESIFHDYNEIDNASQAMFACNVCFHESLHAANRQHSQTFHMQTPGPTFMHPRLILTIYHSRTLTTDILESGCAAELMLWGIIPNWADPLDPLSAEVLATQLFNQYNTNSGSLILSDEQKRTLKTVVGINDEVHATGGMVVGRKQSFR